MNANDFVIKCSYRSIDQLFRALDIEQKAAELAVITVQGAHSAWSKFVGSRRNRDDGSGANLSASEGSVSSKESVTVEAGRILAGIASTTTEQNERYRALQVLNDAREVCMPLLFWW